MRSRSCSAWDCNSFYLIRYPDGKIFQPFTPKDGRYIGTPVYADGKIFFVLAAFPQGCISIIGFDSQQKECSQIAQLPLNEVEDCYNLLLHTSPLMLSRHSGDIFEIVWPERRRFSVGIREALNFRQGDRLYFTAWYEDPDYREETVVRAVADGTVLETFPGDIRIMPNGDKWLLR